MTVSNGDTRRRFLRLAGTAAVASVAGCGGGPGDGEETTEETTATEEANGGGSQDLSGPVPEEYATATSLGGTQRNPDALQTKEAVSYQSEPSEGQECSGCTFYIEDMNDDGLGACAIVEGLIEPQGWCVSYAPYES